MHSIRDFDEILVDPYYEPLSRFMIYINFQLHSTCIHRQILNSFNVSVSLESFHLVYVFRLNQYAVLTHL